jgi:hypothetical protein
MLIKVKTHRLMKKKLWKSYIKLMFHDLDTLKLSLIYIDETIIHLLDTTSVPNDNTNLLQLRTELSGFKRHAQSFFIKIVSF